MVQEQDNFNDYPVLSSGVMGVPITFLNGYCPEQFEIVSLMSDGKSKFYIENKGVYARILIKNKTL